MTSVVTVVIAFFVALFTGLQWLTAREKVLLDLFDRRFALYEELRAVIGQYLGGVSDPKAVEKFTRAASRAQFLFGPEITAFLEERRKDLSREIYPDRPIPVERREAAEAALVARKDRLTAFFKDFDELVSPYMQHHQRAGSSSWKASLAETVRRWRRELLQRS